MSAHMPAIRVYDDLQRADQEARERAAMHREPLSHDVQAVFDLSWRVIDGGHGAGVPLWKVHGPNGVVSLFSREHADIIAAALRMLEALRYAQGEACGGCGNCLICTTLREVE